MKLKHNLIILTILIGILGISILASNVLTKNNQATKVTKHSLTPNKNVTIKSLPSVPAMSDEKEQLIKKLRKKELKETEKIKVSLKNEANETDKNKGDYVYTIARVNIRKEANINSEILLTAAVGTKLKRIGTNMPPEWDTVLINNEQYYLSNRFLTIEKPQSEAKSIEEQIEDNKNKVQNNNTEEKENTENNYIEDQTQEQIIETQEQPSVQEVPVENNNPVNNDDLRYMSAIIYAEAGNQCQAGKQAVGIIVMERVQSSEFSNTVYDVIHQPGQFTPASNGSLYDALYLYDSGQLSSDIISAAQYALQGNTTVDYNGTTYDLDGYLYFSRYVDGCRLQIQDHMFK